MLRNMCFFNNYKKLEQNIRMASLNLSTSKFKVMNPKKQEEGWPQACSVSRYDANGVLICEYVPTHAYVDKDWWKSHGKEFGFDRAFLPVVSDYNGYFDKLIKIVYHIHHHHHRITDKPNPINLSRFPALDDDGYYFENNFRIVDTNGRTMELCCAHVIQEKVMKYFFYKEN